MRELLGTDEPLADQPELEVDERADLAAVEDDTTVAEEFAAVQAASAIDPGPEPANAVSTPSAQPLLRGDRLLGAEARDAAGTPIGVVKDVLVDPVTGELAAVLTAPADAEANHVVRVLVFRGVDIGDDGRASVRVAGAESADAGAYVELFDIQDSLEVAGEIMALDFGGPDHPESMVVLLRDAENVLFRLAIEPAELVRRLFPTLAEGDTLSAVGVETHDEQGKLLVVRSLTHGERSFSIRDEFGTILWNDLAGEFFSARSFLEASVAPPAGDALPVIGWVLDGDRGAVDRVLVAVNNAPRALPWDQLRSAEGGWRTDLERAKIETLPVFLTDDELEEAAVIDQVEVIEAIEETAEQPTAPVEGPQLPLERTRTDA